MIRLDELIEKSGTSYIIAGCGEFEVSGISWSGTSQKNEIAAAFSQAEIENTVSEVVLTEPTVYFGDKTLIFCDENIETALTKIAMAFIETGIYDDYSLPCKYEKTVNGSLIGKNTEIASNVYIAPFSEIQDNVKIGSGSIVESGVFIGRNTEIGSNVRILSGAKIAAPCFWGAKDTGAGSFCGTGRVIIGNNVEIGCNTVIQRGVLSNTVVGDNTAVGNLVDIGHDSVICSDCRIVSQTGIAGRVHIGRNTTVFGQTGIANNVHIGENVVIMGKTSVTKNVGDNMKISGQFGRNNIEELRVQSRIRKLFEKE